MAWSRYAAFPAAVAMIATPAAASTRDSLIAAAYGNSTKPQAIAMVDSARAAASAAAARNPADRVAALDLAMATGYAAKLKRGASDAKSARSQFEALVASNPRDPEALIGLAGWHLETVYSLGGFLASAALGAKKATGLALLNRALQTGGSRPVINGFAALLLSITNPGDVASARRCAEAAVAGTPTTQADQVAQRTSARLLVPLRAGDGQAASALAVKLLPFGRFS